MSNKPTDKILVIADDLTGSGDTAVQYAKRGSTAVIHLDATEQFVWQQHVNVHVVNTHSRSLPPEAAATRVRASVDTVDWSQFTHVYKKIDSTFRGNIGAEMDALLDAGGFDCAILTPAYPQQKRIVEGGYLLVDGRLLEDTPAVDDPVHPVRSSYLPELLKEQSQAQIIRVDVKEMRRHADDADAHFDQHVADFLNRLTPVRADADNRKLCYLFDAATEGDLQYIAAAVHAANRHVLWIGSAGLAGALASCTHSGNRSIRRSAFADEPLQQTVASGADILDVLVVAGSMHPIARKQAAYLRELGFGWLELDPVQLACGHMPLSEAQLRSWAASRRSGGFVLTTAHTAAVRHKLAQLCQRKRWTSVQAGERIAASLGKLTAALTVKWNLSGLVLTGGDISYATMKALDIHALEVIGEVEEGLPHSRPVEKNGSHLTIVTKAGGFGNEQTLGRAAYAAGTVRRMEQ